MKRSSRHWRWAVAGLALATLAGWGLPARADGPPEARRISVAEAKEALAKGAALLVDVRVPSAYAAEHAKGAISIPYSDLAIRLGDLPKDKLIITYCT